MTDSRSFILADKRYLSEKNGGLITRNVASKRNGSILMLEVF